MSNENYIHLCAGTFFWLLVESRQASPSKRKNYNSDTSDLSQNNISYLLTRFILPQFPKHKGNSIDQNVSGLKNCRVEKLGAATPYYDSTYQNGLSYRVDNNFTELLQDWSELIEDIVGSESNPGQCEWIVSKLVEAIEYDQDFHQYHDYYYQTDITKDDILQGKGILFQNEGILFQPFLLSIWIYICKREIDNKIDRSIYSAWKKAKPTKKIKTHVMTYEEIKKAAPPAPEIETESAANDETESAENEVSDMTNDKTDNVVDEEPQYWDSETGDEDVEQSSYGNRTVIVKGDLYQQKAEKIVNIKHVEKLEL